MHSANPLLPIGPGKGVARRDTFGPITSYPILLRRSRRIHTFRKAQGTPAVQRVSLLRPVNDGFLIRTPANGLVVPGCIRCGHFPRSARGFSQASHPRNLARALEIALFVIQNKSSHWHRNCLIAHRGCVALESDPADMSTQIDRDRCKGCGLCVVFCPRHILKLEDGLNRAGYHPAVNHDLDACTACGLCAEMCPETGIRVTRRKKKPRG